MPIAPLVPKSEASSKYCVISGTYDLGTHRSDIMDFKNTKKPESQEEQVSLLWDFVFNFLSHKLRFIDLKIGFVLTLITIILALIGVLILKG